MKLTIEDRELINVLPEKVEQFRQSIVSGRPYVWELRLSLGNFCELENALKYSIDSHCGDHHHLLTKEMAYVVVMYLAEWYKRFYKGTDTMDENKVLSLSTEELKKLYELAGIDSKTFVYNASKNPDKTSYRWLESLQVLGGLAVQAELKRDLNDPLLPQLCRIFHGEEIDIENIKDRGRAVAFQESIAQQHSLYEYLDCILDHAKEPPFSRTDMEDESTMIPELMKRIEIADYAAKREKFDFEWIYAYTASRKQMVRHLRVKMKPEIIGGGRKNYIGYDRLRMPAWGVDKPEAVGSISFYLRFKNGQHIVNKEYASDRPLFRYDNTGSEQTGFCCINHIDENTYTEVPVQRFDKVEIVMKYADQTKVVQDLDVKDYIQLFALTKTTNKFTSRRNSQAMTVVVYSSACRPAPGYENLPVAYAHYVLGNEQSEDYCWCPVSDKLILLGPNGKEIMPPFFNHNGLYQVLTKKYLDTIKYRENIYVLYRYVNAEFGDNYIDEDDIHVLFGRSGLEVRHLKSRDSKESEPVAEYDLEWRKPSGKYVDWKDEEPEQGFLRIRVTVKGLVFVIKVYYVPFEPSEEVPAPIWRNFEEMRIDTALDGVEGIQDTFNKIMGGNEPDTKPLVIGTEASQILVDVYRPIIIRELTHETSNNGKSVTYYSQKDDIYIPLINCDKFSVRDFSKDGVKEYHMPQISTAYYSFPTFESTKLSRESYALEKNASELTPDVPLDYLKVYVARPLDTVKDLYAWNYKDAPVSVANFSELKGDGIVFQSLIVDDSPRDYALPLIKKVNAGWGGKKAQIVVNVLEAFETAAEHKTYFFLFNPLIKCIATGRQIEDIAIPLILSRNYQLSKGDYEHLHRFAVQFHFDWMLLPREKWLNAINEAVCSDEEKAKLSDAIIELFRHIPKCTDEREEECREEFLRVYWTFNVFPKVDPIGETALKLVLNTTDALGRFEYRKEFLKQYDTCRFKFSEMSKATITNIENI